jgi:predicted transcriptional regulator
VIDEIRRVSDRDSFLMTRRLAKIEGLFAGGSSGSAVHVALDIARDLGGDAVVVVIIPDSGTRYLSKVYNDNWMRENQYLESSVNVIALEVLESASARMMQSIPLATTVQDAVNLMREHAISQLPVMEDGGVVGSISEARILDILFADPAARSKPVAEYMEPPFPVLAGDCSIAVVAEHMKNRTTAVMIESPQGFAIITKSDLIDFLTRHS